MRPPARALALLVSLMLTAAACTGGDDQDPPDDPDDPDATEDAAVAGDPDASPDAGPDAGADEQPRDVPLAPGAEISADEEILQSAQRWIEEESGLSEMLQSELFLSSVSQTRDVYHLTYVQQHDEVSVRGAEFVVHVRDTGEVVGASQSLTETLPAEGTTEELDEAEAVEVAIKAVPGEPVIDPTVSATWLEVGEELRLGWEVVVTTEGFQAYSVVVDATDGQVLSVDQITVEHARPTRLPPSQTAAGAHAAEREVAQGAPACDAPPPPSACIYVVNPILASGNPGIGLDQADSTLVGVGLDNLLDPADGRLVGRYVRILESEADTFSDPDNVFGEGGRGGADPTFDAAMIYYWIDYTQQLMQSLGFDYHADDSVDFVPLAGDVLDNAFYVPPLDLLVLGVTSDGQISLAEEAEIAIHEYGHAIVEDGLPGTLGPEALAFNEAFSDMVAFFTTLEFRTLDQGCLTQWFGRALGLPGNCIRRVDTDKVFPDDVVAEVHLDGEIYSGAVWDVFEQVLARETGLRIDQCQDRANPCDAARDEVYATMLASLPFMTPRATLNEAAAAFAAADEVFFDSRNADVIAGAFGAHGLSTTGGSAVQMMSGPMELEDLARSDSQVTLKLSHERRGDLSVAVSVLDPDGELQCTLTLLQPDDSDTGTDVNGRFDLAGTACEEFLPPSPFNIWVLDVIDLTEGASGTYFQFSVIHQGRRFQAIGPSLPIPDGDGLSVSVAIPDAGLPDVQTMVEPPSPPPEDAGTVTAEVAITHPFIGDLGVQLLVLDPDPENPDPLLCALEVLRPEPSDDSDNVMQTVDASLCAGAYPPGPTQVWLLTVQDNAAQDVGTIDSLVIRGPDGQEFRADGPVPIPDNDPEGTGLFVPQQ